MAQYEDPAWSGEQAVAYRSGVSDGVWMGFWRGVVLCAALVAAAWLGGCGGGDHKPEKPTPGVDCQAHPELCK